MPSDVFNDHRDYFENDADRMAKLLRMISTQASNTMTRDFASAMLRYGEENGFDSITLVEYNEIYLSDVEALSRAGLDAVGDRRLKVKADAILNTIKSWIGGRATDNTIVLDVLSEGTSMAGELEFLDNMESILQRTNMGGSYIDYELDFVGWDLDMSFFTPEEYRAIYIAGPEINLCGTVGHASDPTIDKEVEGQRNSVLRNKIKAMKTYDYN